MVGNYLSDYSLQAMAKRARSLNAGEHLSSHLSEGECDLPVVRRGGSLLLFIGSLVAELDRELRRIVRPNFQFTSIAFVPMSFATGIRPWSPNFIRGLKSRMEPPSVYIYTDQWFLDLWDEEYRYPFRLNLSDGSQVKCIYRCWRGFDVAEKGWREFNRGIYICRSTGDQLR
jgi:hypothetical protein